MKFIEVLELIMQSGERIVCKDEDYDEDFSRDYYQFNRETLMHYDYMGAKPTKVVITKTLLTGDNWFVMPETVLNVAERLEHSLADGHWRISEQNAKDIDALITYVKGRRG